MIDSTIQMDNPYKAPDAAPLDVNTSESSTNFFVVSRKKLTTLYILTFGLYGLVWFYENFKSIKRTAGESIRPVPRAIFSVFYTHGLFKRINVAAKAKEISVGWSHVSLASAFVILQILGQVLDQISEVAGLMMMVVFLPISAHILVQVQATVNAIQDDSIVEANNRFTIANYIWCVLGVVFWLLVLVGSADTLGLISLDSA